jgi:hypothetical protein
MGSPSFVTLSKLDRVTLSQELLSMLERQEQRSWHDIVILDGSWFYLNTEHELIWLQPGEEIREKEQRTFSRKT